MINLLPYEEKKQLRAARFNTVLIRYLVTLWMGSIFMATIFAGAYYNLTLSKTSAEQLLSQNQSKSSAYQSVQQQAATINANIASARNVLSQQILYSKVLISIGQITPQGVVIDKLSLSPSTFGTAITLQAYARDSDAALALKTAYQSSSIFSNVSIQNLSGGSGTSGSVSGYPVSITLNVTINKYAAL